MDWISEIKKLRDDRNLSDAKAAAELGISKPFLSEVLNGKKELSAKLKLKILSLRTLDIDQDCLLAFLPSKVASQLSHLDKTRDGARGDPKPKVPLTHDWIVDLVEIRDRQGLNSSEFSDQLGMSQSFVSGLFTGKKPVTWGLKVFAWQQMNYDLSCDTLLNFLPHEIAAQLSDKYR